MRLITLHRKYLLNKINIIVIIFLLLMAIFLAFSVIEPFTDQYSRWTNRLAIEENYEQSYLTFTKIILVIFSCYLFGIAFGKNGDSYAIIITCTINKTKYFITKIISLWLIFTFISLYFLVNYHIIGFIFNDWHIIKMATIKKFVDLYLVSLIYGFLSIILMRLFNSPYTIILTIGLYLASEIILEASPSMLAKGINIFFPTTYNAKDGLTLLYGKLHLIVLGLSYLLLSYATYLKKE